MEFKTEAAQGAIEHGCGLWLEPPVSGLSVTGEDRHRLLNGLVTCDVASLTVGHGVLGFFTDIKGHVLSEVVVRAREDSLLLELPVGRGGEIAQHIERYILADRVEVETPPVEPRLLLLGAGVEAILNRVSTEPLAATGAWGLLDLNDEWGSALAAWDGHYGVPAATLWCAPEQVEGLVSSLKARGVSVVSAAAVDNARVELGLPLFGRDYDAQHLPQETGLDAAVDHDKGCYLGQEVVARLHYRGQVARRVSRVRAEPGTPLEIGADLHFEGRPAGAVTSRTEGSGDRPVFALAMLQRRAFEPGTELTVAGGGSVEVL